jgi:hypothetical protein
VPNDQDDVSLTELLGEHRELPGDDDAMFTVEEIATTNTVLRGTRLMLNDRIGEEAAKPLADILAWTQSILFAMVLEDEADEHSQLKYLAGMFGMMLGDEERAEIQHPVQVRCREPRAVRGAVARKLSGRRDRSCITRQPAPQRHLKRASRRHQRHPETSLRQPPQCFRPPQHEVS